MARNALIHRSALIPKKSQRPVGSGLSKSQQAYLFIKERIAGQEYPLGYRLVLSTIASELGMSVVPVREAIRRLEAEGLVVFERNVGAHVAMVYDTEYRYSMHTLSILEGAATALSAARLTEDDLRRAREVNQEMTDSFRNFDPRTFTLLNGKFHSILAGRCTNPHLLDLVSAERARLETLRHSTFGFIPDRARESVREHERIVRLIEDGAPPSEIEFATRGHRRATLTAYLTHEHPGESLDLPDF